MVSFWFFFLQKFEEELMRQEAHLRETLNIGQDIMKRCHPDALSTLKHWLSALKARWEEVGIVKYILEFCCRRNGV